MLKQSTITIPIPKEKIDNIKRLKHKQSLEDNKDYSFSDMIRMALDKVYPMPEKISK